MKIKYTLTQIILIIVCIVFFFVEYNSPSKLPDTSIQSNVKTSCISGDIVETVTDKAKTTESSTDDLKTPAYIGNKNTKKLHYPYCGSVKQMKEKNKSYLNCIRDDAIAQGYIPCKKCIGK